MKPHYAGKGGCFAYVLMTTRTIVRLGEQILFEGALTHLNNLREIDSVVEKGTDSAIKTKGR